MSHINNYFLAFRP